MHFNIIRNIYDHQLSHILEKERKNEIVSLEKRFRSCSLLTMTTRADCMRYINVEGLATLQAVQDLNRPLIRPLKAYFIKGVIYVSHTLVGFFIYLTIHILYIEHTNC